MTTLSAALIVKDEEKNLPRCLDSIKPWVDEIIVVDTGSEDASKEIAHEYDCKVYVHPWQGDFSLHRNQSMSYCNSDWILIIDADEELIEGEKLRPYLDNAKPEDDMIAVKVYSNLKTSAVSEQESIRIVRRSRGFQYSGIVHNQLMAKGITRIIVSDLKIKHYGYNLDPERMKRKYARSMTLLEKQLKENPGEPFPLYNIAVCCYADGEYARSLDYCKKLHGILHNGVASNTKLFMNIYYVATAAALAMDKPDQAMKWAKKGVEYDKESIDVLTILLQMAEKKNDHALIVDTCVKWLAAHDHYREKPADFFGTIFNYINQQPMVSISLGCVLWQEGKKKEANEAWKMAINAKQLQPEFIDNIDQN